MADDREWVSIGRWLVDAQLLESRAVGRCRIEECQAGCCGHGVYVDLAEAGRIVDEAELVKPHLPPDRREVDAWFDGTVEIDTDFPSGYRVGTEVVPDPSHPAGTTCIFLRPDRRCALQVAAIAAGRHPWDLKPFYSAMFPIVRLGNQVQLDDDNEIYRLGGTCARAEPAPTPLYQVFQDELVLALGQDGYDLLCAVGLQRSTKPPSQQDPKKT